VKSRRILARVLVSCLLTMSSSACDATRPSTSGAPTVPTAPTAPAVPMVTLSGTVAERFSRQPIQGVQVALFPQTYPESPPPRGTPPYRNAVRLRGPIHNHRIRPFRIFFMLLVYAPYGTCAAMSHDSDAVPMRTRTSR
jgi:hypothetical protein